MLRIHSVQSNKTHKPVPVWQPIRTSTSSHIYIHLWMKIRFSFFFFNFNIAIFLCFLYLWFECVVKSLYCSKKTFFRLNTFHLLEIFFQKHPITDVPSSNPTSRSSGLRDSTLLWGSQKTRRVTSGMWDCLLDDGSKLAMERSNSSWKLLCSCHVTYAFQS